MRERAVASLLRGLLAFGLLWVGTGLALGDTAGLPFREHVELQMVAQGVGYVLAVAFALRFPPLSGWRGRGAVVRSIALYLAFMLLWAPFTVVVYTRIVEAFGGSIEPQPHLEYFTAPAVSASFVAVLISVTLLGPLVEEVLFRGYLQDALRELWGPGPAVVLAAAAFGLVHGVKIALPLALLGGLFGYLRERYGGLLAPFAAHAAHNTLTVAVTMAFPDLLDATYG